jgi:two-component system sensor histidine kinase UhpB
MAPLPSARAERGLLRALWHGRSLRARLLLAFALIDFVAVLAAGSVAIVRARTQVHVEMASSMRLAELLVGDAAKFVNRQVSADALLSELPQQLHSLRHVRVTVKDASGTTIAAPQPGRLADAHSPAPGWFSTLVAAPVTPSVVPVTVNGRTLGQVEITGEPADETAEVWGNLVAMGGVAVLLNIAMIGILYVLFGRVLSPLAVLAAALSDLEHRSYGVRLPRSNARELTAIADRFNALAGALETARSQKDELNRRLVTAQDDERRRTALELHDEVGPCLFGLKAYGSSIAAATGALAGEAGKSLSQCAHEILAITDHLQSINRGMLERLRPMALGHVPLAELLGQLVDERSRQHPQILFDCAVSPLARSYGDSIDLTVYRCIQESLTNAIRHARAKKVRVNARHDAGSGLLELTVRDDGCGMPVEAPGGFGIRGMRERVEALGGHHAIASAPGRGTCISIRIPVARAEGAAADAEGSSGGRP